MKVFAYCDQRYEEATRKVVGKGATVLTSPPIFAGDFNPEWWQGARFIYLDLHGFASGVYLYSGETGQWAALSLRTVGMSRLVGAVIFVTTCYLPQTPFLPALLAAGAEAVIAGDGENWANRETPAGAQALAARVLGELRRNAPVEQAVEAAKARLRFSWTALRYPAATQDARRFKIYRR